MKTNASLMFTLPVVWALSACGSDPHGADVGELNQDLALGSRGEGVRAVNAYFGRYGYFPNTELAADYPAWRPIVPNAPVAPDEFDENTEKAVLALQGSKGIPTTGVVDGPTRAILSMPRCGVPDGIVPLDSADKFALYSNSWNKTSITWKVVNAPSKPASSHLTLTQAKDAARAAFKTWQDQISFTGPSGDVLGKLNFLETSGTPDITLRFALQDSSGRAFDGVGGTFGRTPANNAGRPTTCTFDDAEPWSMGVLQGIMTHEIGHALGLDHSAAGEATMIEGTSAPGRFITLDIDDMVAISAKYDSFGFLSFSSSTSSPGARDIGVGNDGSIWIISSFPGDDPVNDGYQVRKWNGNPTLGSWAVTQAYAVRIAVAPDGKPWIAQGDGTIWRATTNDPQTALWEMLPGRANDIAVGANGEVWVIGTDALPGGYGIHKWDEAGFTWHRDHNANGAAVKIAVGPNGAPWVVNSNGDIFRYTTLVGGGPTHLTDDYTIGIWENIAGKKAVDIGMAPAGSRAASGAYSLSYAYAIDQTATGALTFAVYDEQDQNGTRIPAKHEWTPAISVCTADSHPAVSVGPTGNPFVICSGPGGGGWVETTYANTFLP